MPSAYAENGVAHSELTGTALSAGPRLSSEQEEDLLTPVDIGRMSGGIIIEPPSWEEVEVEIGSSEASEPQTSTLTSYIAPLAATQVSSESELQAALAAQAPEIEITAGFPITSLNTIQANYDVLIFSDEVNPVTLSRDPAFERAFFLATLGGKLTLQNIVLDGGGAAVSGVTGSLVEANDQGAITLNAQPDTRKSYDDWSSQWMNCSL